MAEQEILIVEDDEIQRRQLARALEKPKYRVSTAGTGEEALRMLATRKFDLVISDLKMPGISGLELIERIKNAFPHTSLLLVTAHGSIDAAIEAMKIGAEDFLTKPFGFDQLNIVVSRVFEKRDILAENIFLREQLESQFSFANIISKNHKMRKIFNTVASVAPTDSTVLIQGETGTGKELIAKAIHFHSLRKDKRFVAVDCGALPESLLESELFGHEKGAFTGAYSRRIGKLQYADGSTLFLDEVGNMSQAMQMKLLRALEEKQFERVGGNEPTQTDIRLIAATNVDLHSLVQKGEFREDLYYRLNVIPLKIPPLRERTEDIPLLVRHFLRIYRERMGKNISEITHAAIKRLMKHSWPGNVRELENAIERAVATATGVSIGEESLFDILDTEPVGLKSRTGSLVDLPLSDRIAEVEREYLSELLRECGGKTEVAAEKAGQSLRTLQRKLRIYSIRPEDFRPGRAT
jgi:DNA-binding NtrC family response regulator